MAAFQALNWGDLDVFALLVGDGIATLEPASSERSLAWLRSRSYHIEPIDFGRGIGPVVAALGKEFRWEQQFGYTLEAEDRNLARLRDGFWYDVVAQEGLVIELRSFQRAFEEDRDWSEGFLRIISEHSRRHLALGHRAFAVVHVPNGESPVVGCSLGERSVPYPYSFPRGSNA
ncbi:hypothetical protein LJR039_003381 [Pseudorhodoferax sp. LjRoot39]|uniref:hypothetical protein n=1 Tax=Pseudorhodoferax sp. LjRoot39 TaxID=3342328 RepID=UPI003ECEF522